MKLIAQTKVEFGKSLVQELKKLFYLIKREGATILSLIFFFLFFLVVLPGLLQTRTPIAYIVSESMENSYNVGDLIIIKGVSPDQIQTGDSIAYVKPTDPSIIIFHRVAYIYEENEKMFFITKGDNNDILDPWNPVPAENLVGVVIYRIPYVGYIPLVLSNPILLIEVIILFAVLFFAPLPEIKISRRIKGYCMLALIALLLAIATVQSTIEIEKFEVRVLRIELKCSTLRSDELVYYLVVFLRIESKGLWIKSIRTVEIIAYNNSKIVGLGVWKVVYFYHGVKTVSIAVLLKNTDFDRLELQYVIEDIFGNSIPIRKAIQGDVLASF